MKKLTILLFAAVTTAGLYSCFKNPVTGRSSVNFVPESEMRSMATQQYASFLSTNKPMQGTKDAEMVKRVENASSGSRILERYWQIGTY